MIVRSLTDLIDTPRDVRGETWAPRTIDVDVLIYGDSEIESPRLSLPHPRLTQRDFVLQPLSDLNPDLTVNGRTVRALLGALPVVELERVEGRLIIAET